MTKLHGDYSTEHGKMEAQVWTAVLILVMGILIGVAMCCIQALCISAQAEDERDAWVICMPGEPGRRESEVNARSRASKKAEIVGRLAGGQRIRTDGKMKNGYLHCYASTETDECWVYAGYVTEEEPLALGREYMICAPGRVACRKWADGPRTGWARDGDLVTVYWWTTEWCVTDRGFIRSEFVLTGR